MSQEVSETLSGLGIALEAIAGEAHWQLGLAEVSIKMIKETMTKIARCLPNRPVNEVLARATAALNAQEMVRGFSPIQHALDGRPQRDGEFAPEDSPLIADVEEHRESRLLRREAEQAAIEAIYHDRERRALRSRNRKELSYLPGQVVFYWRMGKGKRAKPGARGRFWGPARVLATETKRLDDGVAPSHIVWIVRGARLLRCSPEQLRLASEKERTDYEVDPEYKMPWTMSGVLDNLDTGNVEDISEERPDPEEQEEAEFCPPEEGDEQQWPHVHQSAAHDYVPEFASEPKRRRTRKSRPDEEEEPRSSARSSSDPPPADHIMGACFWTNENNAVEMEIPTATSAKKCKYMTRNFPAYVVSEIKRGRVEVRERMLSPEDKQRFQEAKNREVKQYIEQEVLKRLPPGYQVPPERVLRMRWVLTWKEDPESPDGRKAKGRIVILGYQDPDLTERTRSAPTASRLSRMIFLQAAAHQSMLVERADAKTAFLQGRKIERDLFCLPVPELAHALGIEPGQAAKLQKSSYGLIDAPLEWYVTVVETLRSLGWRAFESEPCMFGVFDEERKGQDDYVVALAAWHVDDFEFAGRQGDTRWDNLKVKLKEAIKWTEWETDEYVQLGVKTRQLRDHSFLLDQKNYVMDIEEIDISPVRKKQSQDAATDAEKTQLMAVLGSVMYKVQKTGPEYAAETGWLQSRRTTATVADLVAANRMLVKVKARCERALPVHSFKNESIALVCWEDAAHGNRPDGKSTAGYIVGATTTRLLIGEESPVSLLDWGSHKIQQVCRSAAAAEARSMADAEDHLSAARYVLAEALGLWRQDMSTDEVIATIPGVIVTDSKNCYDNLLKSCAFLGMKEKMAGLDLKAYKQRCAQRGTSTRWVHGDAMMANSLTKASEPQQLEMYFEKNGRYRLTYDPNFQSARQRKKKGIPVLADSQDYEDIDTAKKFENLFNDCDMEDDHVIPRRGEG